MLATDNNCRLDDLSAIAFNNNKKHMFSSRSNIQNGGMEKEKRGNGKERKKKLQARRHE